MPTDHAVDSSDFRLKRDLRLPLGESAGPHDIDCLVQQRQGFGTVAEQTPPLRAIEQANVALHAVWCARRGWLMGWTAVSGWRGGGYIFPFVSERLFRRKPYC